MITYVRWIREKIAHLWSFVSEDVWDVELSSLSSLRRLGNKSLRVIQLVIRGFR